MKRLTEFVRVSGAFALLLLFVASLASQDSPQKSSQSSPPSQTPVRVTTHLVQIGVIVRDASGPVSNLTKDDFTVLDRGNPQKISVFTLEAIPAATTAPELAKALPQNTFSNLPQYGGDSPRSVTIVLLDNLNTITSTPPTPYEDVPFWLEDHALANAKQHLIEFLKRADPNDRIALYSLTHTLHVICDFTCDRDQLLAIVEKYDARSLTLRELAEPGKVHLPNVSEETDEAIENGMQNVAAIATQARAQTTMDALAAIAGHVADIPGRKNLLWLTANLPFSGHAIARILSRANIAAYPLDARGLLPRSSQENREGIDDEKAYLFGARADAPPAMSPEPIGITSMRDMADDTGGRAFVNTNDLTGAIRQAVEDSAVTYTIGFYIDGASIDGKFHELKVEVKRKGLTLRYPKGYFAFDDAPPTKDEIRSNLLAAVRSPIESSVIPLRVRVERVEKPLPHCLSIFGLIDVHNLRLAQNAGVRTGAVDVITVEQDQTGKVLAQSASTINLRFGEKPYARYSAAGFPFHQFVQPKTGASTLRILVEDHNTAGVGSLVIPLAQIR